jgi:predicted permease
MPDGFGFPARSRVWQTITFLPGVPSTERGARIFSVFGRLKPDVSIEQATAELQAVTTSLGERFPQTNRDLAPRIRPYREGSIGGRIRSTMPVLMVMVAFVLLIACANVANLLLARASARAHEMSVRTALGATRRQIVRQLLVESLLLASLAGAAGLLLSIGAVRLVSNALNSMPGGLPYWISFTMDARVFGFLAAVCLGTAVLCGLVPALHSASARISRSLGEFGRNVAGSVDRRRWVGSLVIVQLALTPILLTGGGLMLRSLVAQARMSPGVETAGVLRARLDLREAKYDSAEARAQFYRRLDAELASARGVGAALASNGPFGGGAMRDLRRDDESVSEPAARPPVWLLVIGPRYFETMGARVLRGTPFTAVGDPQREPEAVINERLAQVHFGSEDPIGRRIFLRELPRGATPSDRWFTIRAIVQNIRQSETEQGFIEDAVAYVNYGENPNSSATIFARPTMDVAAAAGALRTHVEAVDPDLPLFDVMTLDESLSLSDERRGLLVFGGMFTVFALVALVLATVGLYAVTAYAAAQQTREIGVRMAFGAGGREIWWLVTRRTLRHLKIGLSIGIAGSVGVNVLLGNAVVGLRGPVDPVTLFGVVLLLAAASLVACYGPARRATRLDPVVALRAEN